MQWLRSLLRRHLRVTAWLLVLALALAVRGAFWAASTYASSVEVTISRPAPLGNPSARSIVAYHALIRDTNEARRIQRMLNGALDLTILRSVSTRCGMPPVTTRTSYTYDFRFAIASVTTQEFRTEQGGCLLQAATLGVSLAPYDEGRFNPHTASGWSALLGISPALPDVPASD